jgi:WD40 repeat protein
MLEGVFVFLYIKVLSGHVGWVRSIAVDPTNEWFATGSADRTIKVIKLSYLTEYLPMVATHMKIMKNQRHVLSE